MPVINRPLMMYFYIKIARVTCRLPGGFIQQVSSPSSFMMHPLRPMCAIRAVDRTNRILFPEFLCFYIILFVQLLPFATICCNGPLLFISSQVLVPFTVTLTPYPLITFFYTAFLRHLFRLIFYTAVFRLHSAP